MAVVARITCNTCGQIKDVMCAAGYPLATECHECRNKAVSSARLHYLAGLKALPLEERLAKIEEWIYDYKPQYVPPPRF